MDNASQAQVTLRTKRDSAQFTVNCGERLLFAGLRNGLALPYECASGACGSCQAAPVDVADGVLENLYPEAKAAATMPAGRVLLCQTACHGNVDLRMFSKLAPLPDGEIRPDYLDGVIANVEQVAPDTMAFSVLTGKPLAFQAGQFAMVSAEGVPGFRAYSMTSAPGDECRIDFVVRTAARGAFSRWIESGAGGRPVRIFGPLGRAVFSPQQAGDIACIVGGTGIAGIMSILEHASSSGYLAGHKAVLVFGVRTIADLFFRERLDALVEAARGNLDVTVAISAAGDHPLPPAIGRLHLAPGLVVDVANKVLQKHTALTKGCFYLAGPPIVVERGAAMLREQYGIADSDMRFDNFQ